MELTILLTSIQITRTSRLNAFKSFLNNHPINLLVSVLFTRTWPRGSQIAVQQYYSPSFYTRLITSIGVDYLTRRGDLVHRLCQVVFYILVPIDMETTTPFVIFVLTSVYTYLLPLPERLLADLAEEIFETINRAKDPTLTNSIVHILVYSPVH